MGNQSLNSFVGAGIAKYRDARGTIDAFETEIKNRIEDRLRAREWTSIRFDSEQTRGSAGGNSNEPWINVLAKVIVGKDDADFDVGIWWLESGVLVYAGFDKGPDRIVSLPVEAKGRIKPKKQSRSRIYVTAQLNNPEELDSLLDEILESAEAGVKKALGK